MARYSALKIRVFQSCRLRFRYQYIDRGTNRVRPRLRPADTAGSLVHRVLCDFYTKLQPTERTQEAILALFDDGWRALSAGYHRIPGVEQHHDNSVRQLRNFVRHFAPIGEPYLVEPYIQAELQPGITLFGRLDRLDEEPDGTLHIIDYKGGSLPGDIDASQLLFYAVMAEIKFGRRVTRASFWYLDDGSEWTMDLAEAEKERVRMELMSTITDITAAEDFPATIGPHCDGCPYLHGCEVREGIAAARDREGW